MHLLPQDKSLIHLSISYKGFPGGASGKEPACQRRRCKRRRSDPWVGKIPGGSSPTPVCLPEESHGQRPGRLQFRVTQTWTQLKRLSTRARLPKRHQKHPAVMAVHSRRDPPLPSPALPRLLRCLPPHS